METAGFRFERFFLDPGNRQLRQDDLPVDLNARYLDALSLLVGNSGQLVSKDRFLEEVWRGVPVTDEALTQCIRTLRRALGDEASNPRFIETIPKHGYRFIAPVEAADGRSAPAAAPAAPIAATALRYNLREFLLLGGAGTIGAGIAGLIGGLFYGFVGAAHPLGTGTGAASVMLVMLWLTIMAALIGGAGVSFGIAVASFATARHWAVAGGALGGMLVGGTVKLLGIDAFNLLLGQSPGDITGALEGALLGGGVGLGAWLASRRAASSSLRRSVAVAALAGGAAAVLITLIGGRLMGGSLELLSRSFAGSRLRLDPLGGLFGEIGFGPVSRIVTSAMEGALFGGCIVGAIILARRALPDRREVQPLRPSPSLSRD